MTRYVDKKLLRVKHYLLLQQIDVQINRAYSLSSEFYYTEQEFTITGLFL